MHGGRAFGKTDLEDRDHGRFGMLMSDERKKPAGQPASQDPARHDPSARKGAKKNEKDTSKDAEKRPFRVRTLHMDNDESGGH